ncbi:MAG: hypothetical protein KJO90_07930, partial [Eudoraea sp.]|nr:hypothetical protein [Eudoraea sp.]
MKSLYIFLLLLCCSPLILVAQESEQKPVDKPERPAFESTFLIDNPTDKLNLKNTLEVAFQHRFGTIGGQPGVGDNDLAGIWGAANIRVGIAYSPFKWLQVGYGITKFERLQDFNLKVAILRQTRSGRVPFNISYYGNAAVNMRQKEFFALRQDRYSFFHQLIISRRCNPNFSMQIAPSVSHYNLVPEGMPNDIFAVAFGARHKISPGSAIVLEYSLPIASFMENTASTNIADFDAAMNPVPGFSMGMEFVTSSHAFQVYLST